MVHVIKHVILYEVIVTTDLVSFLVNFHTMVRLNDLLTPNDGYKEITHEVELVTLLERTTQVLVVIVTSYYVIENYNDEDVL